MKNTIQIYEIIDMIKIENRFSTTIQPHEKAQNLLVKKKLKA